MRYYNHFRQTGQIYAGPSFIQENLTPGRLRALGSCALSQMVLGPTRLSFNVITETDDAPTGRMYTFTIQDMQRQDWFFVKGLIRVRGPLEDEVKEDLGAATPTEFLANQAEPTWPSPSQLSIVEIELSAGATVEPPSQDKWELHIEAWFLELNGAAVDLDKRTREKVVKFFDDLGKKDKTTEL